MVGMRYAKASFVIDMERSPRLTQVSLNFQHISLNRKGNTPETDVLLWKDGAKMI
jgi:hypothetical protein